jgi:hypothetical protein
MRWVVLLAGLAVMSAKFVLFLALQSQPGYVYSLARLIVATFMGGGTAFIGTFQPSDEGSVWQTR